MTPFKSQLLGLSLGLITAIGCIAYEKIVHNFSILSVAIFKFIEVLIFLSIMFIFTPASELTKDAHTLSTTPKLYWMIAIYILTGATSFLWYIITKNQGVMAGSIYEVKYIIMLALIYIAFGDNKFTLNTAFGVGLAMASIYFISKT